jgi:hypothetical protein
VRDEHVQEALRRVFVYRFMRRDDFAWPPINFPGIRYDADGGLPDDMHIQAPVHLIEAIRAQGDDIVFDDPEADATEAMRCILWDKWTETELGQRSFIGRLSSDRGRAQPTSVVGRPAAVVACATSIPHHPTGDSSIPDIAATWRAYVHAYTR